MLSGNARPVFPMSTAGRVDIVSVGTPVVNVGTTVPVIVVNKTGHTINDIEVSGPATVNGAVVASGDSQGFSPENVPNDQASFGYVFFQSSVPSGAQFSGLKVTAATGESTYFLDAQVSGVSETTDSLGNLSVVGTVTNTNSGTMTSPISANVLCFSTQGEFLGVQTGFTSGNGDLSPGGTATFQDSLYQSCPTYLVGSSGFGHL
jgi:hypothetical protein